MVPPKISVDGRERNVVEATNAAEIDRQAALGCTLEGFPSEDEALAALEEASPTRRYHALARANIARWAAQAKAAAAAEGAGGEGAGGEGGEGGCSVLVLPGDWGAVALEMSRRFAAPAARSSRPAAAPLDLRVW